MPPPPSASSSRIRGRKVDRGRLRHHLRAARRPSHRARSLCLSVMTLCLSVSRCRVSIRHVAVHRVRKPHVRLVHAVVQTVVGRRRLSCFRGLGRVAAVLGPVRRRRLATVFGNLWRSLFAKLRGGFSVGGSGLVVAVASPRAAAPPAARRGGGIAPRGARRRPRGQPARRARRHRIHPPEHLVDNRDCLCSIRRPIVGAGVSPAPALPGEGP